MASVCGGEKCSAEIKPGLSIPRPCPRMGQDRSVRLIHIVGHTDNQGSPAHNRDLSHERAESVVKALTADLVATLTNIC